MRKFENNVSDGWLFKQELRCWRNLARNWKKDVEDSDFFAIFANSNNASGDEAKQLIAARFDLRRLDDIDAIRLVGDDDEEKTMRFRRGVDCALRDIWNEPDLRDECRSMLLEWCDTMERRQTRTRRRKDPIELRIDEICRALKLDEVEREVLTFATVRAMTCFRDFPVGCVQGRHDKEIFFAMALDLPCSMVMKAFAASATLRKFEVIDDDGDMERGSPFMEFLQSGEGEMLEGRFYKKVALDEALPWDFYGKLAEEHGGTLKRMISCAKGTRGANILLYGAPGTGKTSFAKTLARETGLDLYEIRQGDKDSCRDSSQARVAGIRICNGQVPQGRSLILIDEADRLLRTNRGFFLFDIADSSPATSEKGVINSVIDEIRVPTIWICNTPAESIDISVRRRFDYSICFEKLNRRQRQAIWRNNIAKLHLEKIVSEDMIASLADRYNTNAGGITMALENVKRMKPAKGKALELIDKLMTPHCELLGARRVDETLMPSQDYSLQGLNVIGDVSPDLIVSAVRRFRSTKDDRGDPDRPRMNILLWGPPGTGKTEFVKHLGRELNAKVVVKMGSDLLSPFVGMTEQLIKRAFKEAEADNAILFLDEIDGLVQDRTGASRSWEVTQVNELLHQMENFKGVMVGATNFMSNLDAAILRRFTFKLQFDYLTDEGKRLFFERMFGSRLDDADADRLARIPYLAPGDFRTVRQSLYYLAGETTNSMRLDGLERESGLKKSAPKKVGF